MERLNILLIGMLVINPGLIKASQDQYMEFTALCSTWDMFKTKAVVTPSNRVAKVDFDDLGVYSRVHVFSDISCPTFLISYVYVLFIPFSTGYALRSPRILKHASSLNIIKIS